MTKVAAGMSHKLVLQRLEDAAKTDPVMAHADADSALVEFIFNLGHGDVVDAYLQVPKAYP